ncbi:MAG: hypothetical protein JW840_03785 [Candidatus Thermoplasmatota archaeon]|nr:hypothetical protein [Candidatus Thermoplasmatota archaeon]
MKTLLSVLLLGVLSMLFAEVFSGASTLWFIDPWGLFLTFPLYMGHAMFFLNLAFLWKKTSPRQLYFFGMLFGLYEALITKVLWFGYPASTGPMLGYFFGVAWGEFLTLVLFYHPIMSFLIPFFVYELLSRDILPGHERFLQKNWKTLLFAVLLIVMGASFQSNGATYDVVKSVGSMGGTLLIIFLLHVLSKGKSLQSLILGKKGLTCVVVYLLVLYAVTTLVIFPDRLPKAALPYLLIFVWYLVAISLLWVDRFAPTAVVFRSSFFSQKELGVFAVFTVIVTFICSLAQQITYGVLLAMFVSLIGAGVVIFSWTLISLMKHRISQVSS